MEKMKIQKKDLVSLLKMAKREAVVGGKKIAQVVSTVLEGMTSGSVDCTSIVRDGVSSIGRFSVPQAIENGEEPYLEQVFVADIDLMLGALSAHTGIVTLVQTGDSVRLSSKGKQTTLTSSPNAKAFPHTNKTVKEWYEDSCARFNKSLQGIDEDQYRLQDGSTVEGVCVTVPTADLLSAIQSGSINKQMVEKVVLCANPDNTLTVTVGAELKGRTQTTMDATSEKEIATTIGGGFEHILAQCADKECDLVFFDFTSRGAGIAVVLRTNGAVVFQREAKNG